MAYAYADGHHVFLAVLCIAYAEQLTPKKGFANVCRFLLVLAACWAAKDVLYNSVVA